MSGVGEDNRRAVDKATCGDGAIFRVFDWSAGDAGAHAGLLTLLIRLLAALLRLLRRGLLAANRSRRKRQESCQYGGSAGKNSASAPGAPPKTILKSVHFLFALARKENNFPAEEQYCI